MSKLYLLTGATGHLGTVLISKLLERNEKIRVLVLPSEKDLIKEDVEICIGNVADRESLKDFFKLAGYSNVTLIHCAGIVSIASKPNKALWPVNVNGTANMMQMALENHIDRVIYVSSVHAIPEKPYPEITTEVDNFSPDKVEGLYAKSKAEGGRIALEYSRKGLNVSIVHPSGMIGPGDLYKKNHAVVSIRAMAAGLIPCGLAGGFDFVDSRDVAEGILACEEFGGQGEGYILSGEYIGIKDLVNIARKLSGRKPVNFVISRGFIEGVAPLFEKVCNFFGNSAPLITPYSIGTLQTNVRFSHQKATECFGYRPRDMEEAVRGSLNKI